MYRTFIISSATSCDPHQPVTAWFKSGESTGGLTELLVAKRVAKLLVQSRGEDSNALSTRHLAKNKTRLKTQKYTLKQSIHTEYR